MSMVNDFSLSPSPRARTIVPLSLFAVDGTLKCDASSASTNRSCCSSVTRPVSELSDSK
jgi:hypothetical protein